MEKCENCNENIKENQGGVIEFFNDFFDDEGITLCSDKCYNNFLQNNLDPHEIRINLFENCYDDIFKLLLESDIDGDYFDPYGGEGAKLLIEIRTILGVENP